MRAKDRIIESADRVVAAFVIVDRRRCSFLLLPASLAIWNLLSPRTISAEQTGTREIVESRSGAVADAPFPLPAHRTGRADFPHPALGQELTRSPTEILRRSLKRIRPNSSCRPRVGESCRPATLHLVLPSKPLTEPVPRVAVHGSVGRADRSETEVVRPTQKLPVQFRHPVLDCRPQPSTAGQLVDLAP